VSLNLNAILTIKSLYLKSKYNVNDINIFYFLLPKQPNQSIIEAINFLSATANVHKAYNHVTGQQSNINMHINFEGLHCDLGVIFRLAMQVLNRMIFPQVPTST
jgi:hypothetical protein